MSNGARPLRTIAACDAHAVPMYQMRRKKDKSALPGAGLAGGADRYPLATRLVETEIPCNLGRRRGFEHLTHSADQSGSGKRFRYTPKTAASIPAARHEENPQVWFPFEKPIRQFQPVYVRHNHVC